MKKIKIKFSPNDIIQSTSGYVYLVISILGASHDDKWKYVLKPIAIIDYDDEIELLEDQILSNISIDIMDRHCQIIRGSLLSKIEKLMIFSS